MGYDFFSIVSTKINRKDNTTTVFLAGWAADGANNKFGFVVARGTAPVNGAFNSIKVDPEDISDPVVDVRVSLGEPT